VDGHSLEFFIEGTRSRSGKMLSPKTGMMSVVTNVLLGTYPELNI
jgi:glycerol-3-phosphate O-acyltransferase